MAEYREIQGVAVQSLASSTGTIEGQIWYDNVNGVFKLEAFQAAAWSTGATRPEKISGSTSGTKTAGLVAFGYAYPPVSSPEGGSVVSQTYDGTTWSPAPNGNTNRYQTNGSGTQTTTIVVGGAAGTGGAGPYTVSNAAESFNGSSWSSETGMPISRAGHMSVVGDSSSLLATCGADNTSGEPIDTTVEWNGSTWTSGTNYPVSASRVGAVGSEPSAFFYGGSLDAPGATKTANTFTYDGSTWTASTSLPAAVTGMGGRSGNAGLAISAHGSPGFESQTISWDGTTWTILSAPVNNPAPAADYNQSGSSSTDAWLSGRGGPVANIQYTEEWTGAGLVTKTITTS